MSLKQTSPTETSRLVTTAVLTGGRVPQSSLVVAAIAHRTKYPGLPSRVDRRHPPDKSHRRVRRARRR